MTKDELRLKMAEFRIKKDFDVDLIDVMGGERNILAAMMVSTRGEESQALLQQDASNRVTLRGKLGFLMRNRHGTPFEHSAMTFYMRAPICVYREFHRHRIGFSYNEESGRYKQLEPTFYIPPEHRPLVQVGKPGAYNMVPGTDEQYAFMHKTMHDRYWEQYESYLRMLDAGIAKEVARDILGVGIYSSQYVTCNPRSLMSFLSLRLRLEEDIAKFPSKPLWEINQVALQMEAFFAECFPIVHELFVENGYVAP